MRGGHRLGLVLATLAVWLAAPGSAAAPAAVAECSFPTTVQTVTFSAERYPNIRAHYQDALRKGWPRVLVLERDGTDARRDRLLRDLPTRPGLDRDEYPPAVGRLGWLADVDYVPSRENRSHGASLGAQLRRWCDGVRFRYAFTGG